MSECVAAAETALMQMVPWLEVTVHGYIAVLGALQN